MASNDQNSIRFIVEDASRSQGPVGGSTPSSSPERLRNAPNAPIAPAFNWSKSNPMPVYNVNETSRQSPERPIGASNPEKEAEKELADAIKQEAGEMSNLVGAVGNLLRQTVPVLGGLITKVTGLIELGIGYAATKKLAEATQGKETAISRDEWIRRLPEAKEANPAEIAEYSLRQANEKRQSAADAQLYRNREATINADPAAKAEASLRRMNDDREEAAKATFANSRQGGGAVEGEAAEAAAGGIGALATAAGAAALAIGAAAAAAYAFNYAVDKIVQRAQDLQKYSPGLSQVNAQAEIRQMMADMREAQTNGGSYARVVDEQSKLSAELQQTFAPFMRLLADMLGDVLHVVNSIMEVAGPQISAMLELTRGTYNIIVDIAKGDLLKLRKDISEMPANIAKAMERNKDNNLLLDQFEKFAKDAVDFVNQQPKPGMVDPNVGMGIRALQF